MTSEQERIEERLSANGGLDRLVERLAERLGVKASAATVFGTPVERSGTTVIPVARVRYAFGGGGGRGPGPAGGAEGEGSGGGGMLSARPLGYIEVSGGEASFKRIVDAGSLWTLPLAGGIAAWLILRGMRALRKA